jgi:hypothetical protein
MKHTLSILKMLTPMIVMSFIILEPTAAPIITPRATIHTIIVCHSQITATVMVTDSRGHIYTQTCSAGLRTMLGYPGLYPTEDAPWLMTISVQPKSAREGLPRTCRSQITRVPIHLECAAASPAPLTVDVDMILTLDFGGMWT